MAKNREQKHEIVKILKSKIGKAKSIVFTKFDGLGVKDNEELRKNLKAEGSEYYVAKKTLLNMAFTDEKIKDLDVKKFDGRVAVVFGYEDEVAPARVVADFQKEHEDKVDFLGGILEGKNMDAGEVLALSAVPSRHELYAKLVGSINAPVSGFVNALAGNIRKLVYALNAIKEIKE